MAKIKKISELEQLSSLSSSSNVIIEENGKAILFAASGKLYASLKLGVKYAIFNVFDFPENVQTETLYQTPTVIGL